jgi:hypothetical protein
MTLRSAPINKPAKTAHSGRGPFAVLRRAKSVKNASEIERDTLLDDAERIETCAAWLVLGAIVLEAVVWMSPLSPSLFRLGNFTADAAVALGIYGEMRFGHVVADILKIRLVEALSNADAAHMRADAANARAEQARLELQKFRAPRGPLLATMLGDAKELLGRYAKTQFDTAYGYPNQEQGVLVGLIQHCLIEAGWWHLPWNGGAILASTPNDDRAPSGVANVRDVLVVAPDKGLLMAADALVSVLAIAGIGARTQIAGGPRSANENTIHILVGEKS